jgi:two-component system NtrC family sensor kinase
MEDGGSDTGAPGRRPIQLEDSASLSRRILRCAIRGLSRMDFLREVSEVLIEFSGCDAVEVRLSDGALHYRWEATLRPVKDVRFELVRWTRAPEGKVIPARQEKSDLERLCRDVACRQFDSALPCFTANGSFWTGDTWEPLARSTEADQQTRDQKVCVGGHHRSLAVMRFFVDDQTIGLLHIKSERRDFFTEEDVEFYEGVAQTLGLAVADRRAEAALRERVKELTCLYGIAQVVEQEGLSLEEMLQRIVNTLPPSWQYPENAAARITVDGQAYLTTVFQQSKHRQSADIVVGGRLRGVVEVVYLEDRPELAVGAFLKEEEKLIDAVARDVALIVERKEAEEERSRLQQQLIHADRLATIGELAAGVAHELNEPLASILGFAQLAKKGLDEPRLAERDLDKIIRASLYAREVIRKLMVFARQMPPRKDQIDLNQVVEDGLYFLEDRCTRKGIVVVRELASGLPMITADPAQLKQVLVNLVVNAVQAMPDGGTLTVSTRASDSCVLLTVVDTGVGMSEDVREKILLPFFTTKDVNEGTGLGLAVVHGIVTSHGGSIKVESQLGLGTRFEIRLPITGPGNAKEAGQDDARN